MSVEHVTSDENLSLKHIFSLNDDQLPGKNDENIQDFPTLGSMKSDYRAPPQMNQIILSNGNGQIEL